MRLWEVGKRTFMRLGLSSAGERADRQMRGPRYWRTTILAGVLGLLVAGLVLSSPWSDSSVNVFDASLRPGVQKHVTHSGTRPQTSDPRSYRELTRWVETNAGYLGGMDLVKAAELADRLKTTTVHASPRVSDERGDLKSALTTHQRALLKNLIHRYELDGDKRKAPFRVITHDVIRPSLAKAAYEIEVLTWDAYPEFPVPANIYRPLKPAEARLPVIITPLGCQTHLGVHNELNSVQRRAANLALRGFLVLAMGTGTCFDGVVGKHVENGFAFEQYGVMSGSGFSTRSIEILMLERALDYLATRPDVDMRRVGATGYSHGGGLSYYLTLADTRVSALAVVATSIGKAIGEEIDQRYFIYGRHPAMYSSSPDIFVTSYTPPQVFPSTTRGTQTDSEVLDPWNDLGHISLLAPRSVYIVQGRGDPGTSIPATKNLVRKLSRIYMSLDAEAVVPRLTVVDGPHTYDAQRRRLVTDWFAKVLYAKATLAPPGDRFEHETPILNRKVLERIPPEFGKVTLRTIHALRAKRTIDEQRARQPFGKLAPRTAKELLHRLLMLPDAREKPHMRPVMLDSRGFTLATHSVSAEFWLLPLTRGLSAAALTITPEQRNVKSVTLYLLSQNALVPTWNRIEGDLSAGRSVLVVYLPAFGPLRSTQDKLGYLAMRMPTLMGRSLLGLGVESTQAALDLVTILYPDGEVVGYSEGVDAGNVLAFTTALDERISEAHAHEGVDSFMDFLTAPTNPIPSPTLAIPGLASYVDIPDLHVLAGDGRLMIESESDLSEYVLDLRPRA